MTTKTITSVLVSNVAKRRFPEKHYVYVISVRWSDGTSNVIYRRYSQFFNLQGEIIDNFPNESGKDDPEDRIIPFLPGKILFRRSNTREVALMRQPLIDEYCQKLITMPSRISECETVIDFFLVNDEDINHFTAKEEVKAKNITTPIHTENYVAIADYKHVSSHEVSLTAGIEVDVIEKSETGWWLVSVEDGQGWVPSTYLERADGEEDHNHIQNHPDDHTSYICTNDYEADSQDEVSLKRGVLVEVLTKKLDGWWWIKFNNSEGWAPATYLEKLEEDKLEHYPKTQVPKTYPVEIIRSLHDVTTLKISGGATRNDVDIKPIPEITNKPTMTNKPIPGNKPTMANKPDIKPTIKPKPNAKPQLLNVSKPTKAPKPVISNKVDNNNKNGSKPGTSVVTSLQEKIGAGLSVVKQTPVSDEPIELRTGKKDYKAEKRHSSANNPRFSSQPPRKDTVKRMAPPKRPQPPSVRKEFYTMADFTDHANDGLSFTAGQKVKIIERNTSGWWYVEIDASCGWIPASYVETKTIKL